MITRAHEAKPTSAMAGAVRSKLVSLSHDAAATDVERDCVHDGVDRESAKDDHAKGETDTGKGGEMVQGALRLRRCGVHRLDPYIAATHRYARGMDSRNQHFFGGSLDRERRGGSRGSDGSDGDNR